MKKLIGLALLTATLFADSSEDTLEIPVSEASIIPTDVNNSAVEIPTDEASITEPVQPTSDQATSEPLTSENVQASQPPIEMCCYDPCDAYGSYGLFEFKMGYFRFGDKKLRHQYDEGLLDLQLSTSIRLWKPFYAYMSLEYIGADGRLHHEHHRTKIKIRMVPISLGLRFMQKVTYDLKFYLTAGPRYYFVHQWTRESSQTPKGFGGFVNTGFIYYISHNFVADLFGEYSFKKMHLRHLHGKHQVGGLTLGAGIGYFW